MFKIDFKEDGSIGVEGRFDASCVEEAKEFLNEINDSAVIDLAELEYISSAGLGVLVGAQKRLTDLGGSLRIVNVRNHIKDIFRFSGLNRIFEID